MKNSHYYNYERSYQGLEKGQESFIPAFSLIDFYHKEVRRRVRETYPGNLDVLELGCGQGSLFSGTEDTQMNVLAVDISKTAIELAKKNTHAQNESRIQYLCADACTLELESRFHFVYDSHLFHCLCLKEDRMNYLKKVCSLVHEGAYFALETMVAQKKMEFENGYLYKEDEQILYKETEDENLFGLRTFYGKRFVPARSIRRSHEIEEELTAAGFRIIYFQIHSGYKVIYDEKRIQALDGDPDLLRIICQPNVLSQR